jgi:hypothetical protein
MRRKMRTRKRGGDYLIGFGRPPTGTRFRPGHSGNPKGRPKGARNAASLARDTLERKISVTARGRKRSMSVREAAYGQLAERAISGEIKAFAYLLSLEAEAHPAESERADPYASPERALEIIQAFLDRRRAAKGNTK